MISRISLWKIKNASPFFITGPFFRRSGQTWAWIIGVHINSSTKRGNFLKVRILTIIEWRFVWSTKSSRGFCNEHYFKDLQKSLNRTWVTLKKKEENKNSKICSCTFPYPRMPKVLIAIRAQNLMSRPLWGSFFSFLLLLSFLLL